MSGILTIDRKKLVLQAGQIQNGTPTIAVVKNNAYNFGLEFAVRAFLDAGITAFATTSLKEAEKIRSITDQSMIFLLNPTTEFEAVRGLDLSITLPSLTYYEKYREELSRISIHIEYAGLFNRSGFDNFKEVEQVLHHQAQMNEVERFFLEGLWCHFGYADEFDGNYEIERKNWLGFLAEFDRLDMTPEYVHAQNTASFVRDGILPGHTHTRLGIGLYGSKPYSGLNDELFVQPFELYSSVVQIREMDENMPMGYGGSFVAGRKTKVAIVDIGYGDGVLRKRAEYDCLINGRRYPIVSLMMSHMIVEVDEEVSVDDKVFIYHPDMRLDEYTFKGVGANSEQLATLNYNTLTKEISHES
ncbi:alanine racemase [Lacicoccus alkaliphilus]|uniref:Alanine racemase n=1 Tax=Lacicoccus alkaliphilus DSM 16010 TaxID=1123231 RepID=A0A1M7B2A6_9BACL|nr:alanine racemase [Salinicoccus alkaliphilus]SHL49148.1 alanine racemase [Salinicoccus alkaliphilus DSM 16010]